MLQIKATEGDLPALSPSKLSGATEKETLGSTRGKPSCTECPAPPL